MWCVVSVVWCCGVVSLCYVEVWLCCVVVWLWCVVKLWRCVVLCAYFLGRQQNSIFQIVNIQDEKFNEYGLARWGFEKSNDGYIIVTITVPNNIMGYTVS